MTAKPGDWKRLPFKGIVPIPYRAAFDDKQYAKLSPESIPTVMEDKWFVYLDDGDLCFHPRRTGE